MLIKKSVIKKKIVMGMDVLTHPFHFTEILGYWNIFPTVNFLWISQGNILMMKNFLLSYLETIIFQKGKAQETFCALYLTRTLAANYATKPFFDSYQWHT